MPKTPSPTSLMRPTLCPSPPSPPKLWSTTVRKHKIHFHLPLMCLLNYVYTNLDKRETSILIDFSKASDHSTGIKKEPCEDLVRWLAGSPPGHVLSVPYMWSEPGHQARPAVLLSVNKRCPPWHRKYADDSTIASDVNSMFPDYLPSQDTLNNLLTRANGQDPRHYPRWQTLLGLAKQPPPPPPRRPRPPPAHTASYL